MNIKKVGVMIVILVLIVVAGYFAFFMNSFEKSSFESSLSIPLEGLTDEQAVQQFNESFVLYLLYSISVDSLHNTPFSQNKPSLVVSVGNEFFNAVVDEGKIYVYEGNLDNPDVIISTTATEAVAMLRDKNHIIESFKSGKSSLSMEASKLTLVSKGYTNIYTELTGQDA